MIFLCLISIIIGKYLGRLWRRQREFFYSDRIKNAKNKQKESWHIVNDLRGKNENSHNYKSDISVNDLNTLYCTTD